MVLSGETAGCSAAAANTASHVLAVGYLVPKLNAENTTTV